MSRKNRNRRAGIGVKALRFAIPLAFLCGCAGFPGDRRAEGNTLDADAILDRAEETILEALWVPDFDRESDRYLSCGTDLETLAARDFASTAFRDRVNAVWTVERTVSGDTVTGEKLFSLLPVKTTDPAIVATRAFARQGGKPQASFEKLVEEGTGDLFASLLTAKVLYESKRFGEALVFLDESREAAPNALVNALDKKRAECRALVSLAIKADGSAAGGLPLPETVASKETMTVGEAFPFFPGFNGAFPVKTPESFGTTGGEILNRGTAAMLFWNAYAEAKADPSLLTKYTLKYGARASGSLAVSPIPDVPFSSGYFDSIMGAVEKSFMDLPDGKSFSPGVPITGVSFLESLSKVLKATR